MGTEKLFYTNPMQNSCYSEVLSCCDNGKNYEIILNQTVFYPEGGGQPGDTGFLSGIRVTDTKECGENIVHYCTAPVEVGSTVHAEIDWDRRFDFMQQHSGEHIVSGLIHAAYGYQNVGFHMGSDTTTIDFDGMLTSEQIAEIERKANETVWKNCPLRIWFPTEEERSGLAYRSKKTLSGAVRIVEIPDTDVCACCGTHVLSTGQIGLIQIISAQKFHDGIRMELLCGKRAYAFASMNAENNHAVAKLFSVKPAETPTAAERALNEKEILQNRITELENESFARIAKDVAHRGDVFMVRPPMSSDALRRLGDFVLHSCGGKCAIFSGSDDSGYKYVIGSLKEDISDLVRRMNESLHGRGGGKNGFVQGSIRASAEEIDRFFG